VIRGIISRALAEVLGYELIQLLEVKIQSSFSRRGEGCILDQVNFLPCRLTSLRPKVLIAELNLNISVKSPPGLFLSSGFLIRLKSPKIIQSRLSGITIFLNQLRKEVFPSAVQGPYTQVRIQAVLSCLEQN